MKEIKNNRQVDIYLILFLFSLFTFYSCLTFSSAALTTKVLNSSIQNEYAPSASLAGSVNLSLKDVQFDEVFTFYESSIKVIDLLYLNGFSVFEDFNCSNYECGMMYGSIGDSFINKNFILDENKSKVLGAKITEENIDSIGEMIIELNSDAIGSCNSQLAMDLFNDGFIDWVANKKSNSVCSKSYGCYSSSTKTAPIQDGDSYCQTINTTGFPDANIGAELYGSGSATFEMSFSDLNGEYETQYCEFSLASSSVTKQEGKCSLNSSLPVSVNAVVCLELVSGSGYSLYYETFKPVCGYTGDYDYDFSIFIEPYKYEAVNNIIFNSSDSPDSDIETYLLDNYPNGCSSGCFIPFSIYSYVPSQLISINAFSLNYKKGLWQKIDNLYLLDLIPSLITMSPTLVNLNKANFSVPSVSKNYKIPFKLEGETLTNFNITVLKLPEIDFVYPTEVPGGVEVNFYAAVSGENATNYFWFFGDNSSIVETSIGKTTHKYSNLGTYNLILNVTGELGGVSKSFEIRVVSPKEFVNETLVEYKTNVANLKRILPTLPANLKSYIESQLNLSATETALNSIQTMYNNAGNNEQTHLTLMNSLQAINLPSSINITKKSVGKFVMDPSKISLNVLKDITEEQANQTETSVREAVFDWFVNNLIVDLELKTYSFVYKDHYEPIATNIKFNLIPLTPTNPVFFVLNLPKESISGLNNLVSSGSSFYVSLDLSTPQSLEFFVNTNIDYGNLPFYFSTSLSKLNYDIEVTACNYNKICEKNLGENSTNCRADCRPWKFILWWLVIVLIVFLVLYILVQEWYKRHYESYLFPNPNDLYNLINFINNAEKQGFKKEEMFNKLKSKGWSHEQLVYAYKKYKGQRTGMLEIPIFRHWENKKVKREIEKRSKNSQSSNPLPNKQNINKYPPQV